MDDASLPKKSSPGSIARNDLSKPRALRPVSGAEAWGAAPMPPPEAPRRKAVAIVAVCSAALATAATLALLVAPPIEAPGKLTHTDAEDWASRAKRLIPRATPQVDPHQFRTAGIAPRPKLVPRPSGNLGQPQKTPDPTTL